MNLSNHRWMKTTSRTSSTWRASMSRFLITARPWTWSWTLNQARFFFFFSLFPSFQSLRVVEQTCCTPWASCMKECAAFILALESVYVLKQSDISNCAASRSVHFHTIKCMYKQTNKCVADPDAPPVLSSLLIFFPQHSFASLACCKIS